MRVHVRYFAALREALGSGEVVQADAACTVGALRDLLMSRSDAHARVLARTRAVRAALDHAACDDSAGLHEDAEVAFFPPVTGG